MATGNGDNKTSENSLVINLDMTIDVDSTAKCDLKELDEDSQGVNGLSNQIASARKALFKSASGSGDEQIVTTTRSRKLVPIKKTGGVQDDSGVSGIACKAESFVEGTNFNARDAPLEKKTPTKDSASKRNKCMVKVHLKVLHSMNNVQKTVLGMLDHCLAILHKQDKKACFVNKKRTLEAYKATDFPWDFTDFYNKWGKWDESVQVFLNTNLSGKSFSFTGSFNFWSK
jgi:hypothetical protein